MTEIFKAAPFGGNPEDDEFMTMVADYLKGMDFKECVKEFLLNAEKMVASALISLELHTGRDSSEEMLAIFIKNVLAIKKRSQENIAGKAN